MPTPLPSDAGPRLPADFAPVLATPEPLFLVGDQPVNLTAPSFPQTTPPSFILVSGENSKGFDGDVTFSVNKNVDLLGSFAFFRARVPLTVQQSTTIIQPRTGTYLTELPVGNVSENTLGFWGRYKFTEGDLKGFSAGLGVSYASKKAITDSANSTWYGYVPERTLVNVYCGCEHGPFKYNLNIDNLFDTKYIYAARNQSLSIPGTGFNVKAAIT